MSNLLIHDLNDSRKLDRQAMAKVRGGMFGALLSAMASYSSSRCGSTDTDPTVSGITITKSTDSSSYSLW